VFPIRRLSSARQVIVSYRAARVGVASRGSSMSSKDGVFAIIAMDQRNTLRRMFKAVDIDASAEDIRAVKADVARALTPAQAACCSTRPMAFPRSPRPTRSPPTVACLWLPGALRGQCRH
jgi:hypothetical protein